MNIFVLDLNHQKCAEYHNSKHCVKMICEGTQILSTVLRLTGIEQGYKITHQNHPCTIWARKSLSNWLWLFNLVTALNNEYRFRYNKKVNHKSFDITSNLSIPNIKDIGLTSFALAMPDKYKTSNAVESYRNYYKGDKRHLAEWKNRNQPYWWE